MELISGDRRATQHHGVPAALRAEENGCEQIIRWQDYSNLLWQ
jgi:hypothetical protein